MHVGTHARALQARPEPLRKQLAVWQQPTRCLRYRPGDMLGGVLDPSIHPGTSGSIDPQRRGLRSEMADIPWLTFFIILAAVLVGLLIHWWLDS